MSAKFSFQLSGEGRHQALPHKLLIVQQIADTEVHILLKLLGYLLFFRERLQMSVNLHMDTIQYVPDLVELNYEMRPVFWAECGDCSIKKLDKLAVKAPEATVWVLRESFEEVDNVLRQMKKNDLRQGRYRVVGFPAEMIREMAGLLDARNHVHWGVGLLDPPNVQFDFNECWFDEPIRVEEY